MQFDNLDFVHESTPEAQAKRRQFHHAIPAGGGTDGLVYPADCPWAAIHGGYAGVIRWSTKSAPPEARANTPWQHNTAML